MWWNADDDEAEDDSDSDEDGTKGDDAPAETAAEVHTYNDKWRLWW